MNPLQPQLAMRIGPEHQRLVVNELVAEEAAVALLFNGVSYAVMMASPTDLHDYAVGFALSEGIIVAADELELVDQVERESGIALHLSIPSARFAALEQRQRLVGTSGCGLCGTETLEQALRKPPALSARANFDAKQLASGFEQLAAQQPLNKQCGALHAAAALVGTDLLIREDVGRHNAVDKVIGAVARQGLNAEGILVTSRASYELVHKVVSAQIPLLAAVSAPTAHAIRLADECGLTLVAFARQGRMTLYAGQQPQA